MPIGKRYRRRVPRKRVYKKKSVPKTGYGKKRYVSKMMKTRRYKAPSIHVSAKTSSAYGPSFTKVVLGSKMMGAKARAIEKIGSRNTFQFMNSSTATSATGKQNWIDFPFSTADDLRAMADSMGVGGDNSDSVKNTNDWVLTNEYTKYEISNQGSSMAYVDLYFYVCRRDSSVTPSELWIEGNQEQQGNPGVTIQQPGLLPFGHDRIGIFYKLKKVVHHCILPGQTHLQSIDIRHNKIIHNELLWSENTDERALTYLGGITYFVQAVIRGAGAVNEEDEGTIAPTSLIFTAFKTIKASWSQDVNNNLRYDNFITQTGPATQYNQGSGQQEIVNTFV